MLTIPKRERSNMRMNRYGLLALVLLVATSATEAAPKLKILKAEEIRQTLIGNVITDGFHWRYYLKADGSIEAFEMGRSRKGRWSIKGNRLCLVITAGAAPDECWNVMREGTKLVLGINGNPMTDIQVEPPKQRNHNQQRIIP